MNTEITKQEKDTAIQEPTTPAHLLELAISQNVDVERLEKLMQLQKAWEADQARKAFFESLNEFQAKVPEIRKVKTVSFGQNKTEYKYAPLADIVRQIKDTCRECGLSYRWEIQDTKEEIKVTCLVTHTAGHTERTTMTASPDTSGSKNPIQARGSAIEYLKRYTLVGSLGLSTADSDVDGRQPEIDMDILHAQFISVYNKLIQLDSQYTKWHTDNWKTEPTQALYLQAIRNIRNKLTELQPKEV